MKISFGSLRTRLILIILLAVIPALGLTLYSGLEQRRDALSRAQENALRMAENASDEQERLIENTRQIFFAISQLPEIQNLNPAGCSKILKNIQSQSKGYTMFFAIKPDGDLFASALPVSGRITFTDRAWYQLVLKTREFVISEYMIGRISGKAAVTLVYPVLNRKGEMKAILGTGLDLGWLNQFMAESKLPVGTTLTVIDRKGTILLRYPEPEKFVGKTMPEGSILKAILAKEEGVSEAIGLDGIPRLYGFTSLDRFARSVYVSVGIPKEIAFAKATRDMRRNIIFLGIVGALAIIAAWFGSSLFIMRPIDRLLGATKRLAEGDLTVRTGPRYNRGEMGQLAFAFDRMADALSEKEAQLNEYTQQLEQKVQERTLALRESEERFRVAAESSTDLIYEWDIKERVDWFGKIDELLGYSPSEFPRTFEAWVNSAHPEDRDRLMAAVKSHLEKNEAYDIEYRVRKKDGTYRYWWARGTAVRDEKGNPYRWIGAISDITEHKRAEEALRVSEEHYKTLFSETLDGICLADAETGIIIDCNQAMTVLVCRERAELIGRPQTILHPPQNDKAAFSPTFKQHLTDKQGQIIETQVVTRTGDIREVEIKANFVNLQGRKLMQGLFHNITERKQAEEALRLANAYNRSLIEASLDPLVTIGPNGKITDVNAGTETVTGYSRDELIGKDFSDYFTEQEKARAGYQQVFREGFVRDYGLEIRHQDGHLTPVLYNASIYRDEAGRVIGVFAAARDITERKRAEEEIHKLNAELEQRVRDRTAQLEAANKELEAFSYSVSHDLRAPLRAIDGFSRILLEDYISNLDEEGKRVLNVIRNNTQKMGQLIDDLLLFSRLGRQEIRVSKMDMGKLAKAVSEELKLAVPERKLKFAINTLIPAQGDQAMIRQVFVNLLSNAVKFTRPKERAVIEVDGRSEGNENVYTVKDNGVGFDMQYVGKLFGVFQRLHSAAEFEGTGVGLAIVQRIIHRHGGRVWAEGKVGEGATFYFTLPRKGEGR
jgi:PAS domain S-box-containing protein